MNEETYSIEEIASHVDYEIRMFFIAFDFHIINMNDNSDKDLTNLIFEAMLIHFRNLILFFMESNKANDITYKDIIQDRKHEDFKSAVSEITKYFIPNEDNLRTKLNKQLAHLTKTRIDNIKTKIKIENTEKIKALWKLKDIYEPVSELLNTFNNYIDETTKSYFPNLEFYINRPQKYIFEGENIRVLY